MDQVSAMLGLDPEKKRNGGTISRVADEEITVITVRVRYGPLAAEKRVKIIEETWPFKLRKIKIPYLSYDFHTTFPYWFT